MARDVAILTAAGFTLTDVETIEIFPQTSHVETLLRLVRGKR
jgi:23S rRNA (uracil1939-C5)-methyltransferase